MAGSEASFHPASVNHGKDLSLSLSLSLGGYIPSSSESGEIELGTPTRFLLNPVDRHRSEPYQSGFSGGAGVGARRSKVDGPFRRGFLHGSLDLSGEGKNPWAFRYATIPLPLAGIGQLAFVG